MVGLFFGTCLRVLSMTVPLRYSPYFADADTDCDEELWLRFKICTSFFQCSVSGFVFMLAVQEIADRTEELPSKPVNGTKLTGKVSGCQL